MGPGKVWATLTLCAILDHLVTVEEIAKLGGLSPATFYSVQVRGRWSRRSSGDLVLQPIRDGDELLVTHGGRRAGPELACLLAALAEDAQKRSNLVRGTLARGLNNPPKPATRTECAMGQAEGDVVAEVAP